MFRGGDLRKGVQMMKQLTARGEKTDVMTDELSDLEKKLDTLKHVYSTSSKKIANSLQSSVGDSDDKRRKKIPEFALSNTFRELTSSVPNDSATYIVLNKCAEVLGMMTEDLIRYQKTIEEKVVAELTALSDEKIVDLERKKKDLKDLGSKMDASKNRYAFLLKQAQQTNQQVTSYANPSVGGWNAAQTPDSSSANVTPNYFDPNANANANVNAAAFGEDVRVAQIEASEAEEKMERCRDELTVAMRSFCRREAEHVNSLVQLLCAQLELHRCCFERLETIIPQCTRTIQEMTPRPVFGVPLDEHLATTGRRIAVVIEEGYQILTKRGLEEEGLFRLAASQAKLKRLKQFYDFGKTLEQDRVEEDVHVIAGAVKQYLRELPEPLLGFAQYDDWVRGASLDDRERIALYRDCVRRLPQSNRENLDRLIQLLIRVVQHRDRNKMTEQNVSICIGPNLLWNEAARTTAGDSEAGIIIQVCPVIVETFITHYDRIFEQHSTGTNESSIRSADDSGIDKRNSGIDSRRMGGSFSSTQPSRPVPQRRPPPPPQAAPKPSVDVERDRSSSLLPSLAVQQAVEPVSTAVLIDFGSSQAPAPANPPNQPPGITSTVAALSAVLSLQQAGSRLTRSASSVTTGAKTATPRPSIEPPRLAPPPPPPAPPPSSTYLYTANEYDAAQSSTRGAEATEYANASTLMGTMSNEASSGQTGDYVLETPGSPSKQQRNLPPAPPFRRLSQTQPHKHMSSVDAASSVSSSGERPPSPTQAVTTAPTGNPPPAKPPPPAPPARTYGAAMPPPRR